MPDKVWSEAAKQKHTVLDLDGNKLPCVSCGKPCPPITQKGNTDQAEEVRQNLYSQLWVAKKNFNVGGKRYCYFV